MGAGGNAKVIELTDFEKMPNKSYICMKCQKAPEIKGIDINKNIIEIDCKEHNNQIINLNAYLNKQYDYFNCKCKKHNKSQKDYLKESFHNCYACKEILCDDCLKEHDRNHQKTKFNLKCSYCDNHFKYFIKYCPTCKENRCPDCVDQDGHNLIAISNVKRDDIEYLKKKKEEFIEKKKKIENIINLLDMLIETADGADYPNYFYRNNISKVAKVIKANEEEQSKMEKNKEDFEKKIVDYLNERLELNKQEIPIKIDGKKLDLSGRLIEPWDLNLFSLIEFPNLEELCLSKNQIKDLNLLNNFNVSKIKILDLSNNEIEDLCPLKNLLEKMPKLEELFLNNNKIKNARILRDIYPKLKKIFLDGNDIQKDSLLFICVYFINEQEFSFENKIRIFGDTFVNKNKNNCKIIINEKKKEDLSELSEFYYYNQDDINRAPRLKIIDLIITGNINDMSGMFANCISLKEIQGFENFDTSNVEYMDSMFYCCNKLEQISDISRWNISKVKSMKYMFCNCTSLKNLPPLDNWNMTQVDFDDMFSGCNTAIYPQFYMKKIDEGYKSNEDKK